ncbi:MAG: hypothetical protein HYT16_00225 [DPANN group archaeon]|nr:hypothetical protein [DPANN group archaeon]
MSELYYELIDAARKEIELADHLLYVTYPMIKETKFLLAISEHVIKAANQALHALLEFEHTYKRVEMFSTNFAVMISVYRNKIEPFYNFDQKFYRLLNKMQEIQRMGIESAIRFRHGERYVLAGHDYRLTTIDYESVKRYSNLTKGFVGKIDAIIKAGA